MDNTLPGVDETLLEVLRELVARGKERRAEGILKPKPAPGAESPEMPDADMAELEAMLSEKGPTVEVEVETGKKEDDEEEM